MTRPVITALPAAPTRGEDPATFAAKANTFVAALPAYGTESNALGVFMENEADAAQASRIAAEAAETGAEAAETAALAAQAAAEAASNATEWVSGQAYDEGDVVWSPINYLSYRANTNTSGTTDPSLSASWTSLGVPLPVSVANGGTGVTTLTASAYLKGNGTSAIASQTGIPAGDITSGTLVVARGGTGLATLTANNVLLGNGTSAFQVVAPSTSGNVLTSNGTTWTSAPGPAAGLTLVQTVNATGASSTAIINGFSSTYDTYVLIVTDVYGSIDNYNLELTFYINGSEVTANYKYAYSNVNSSSAESNIGATSNSTIRLANAVGNSGVNRTNCYQLTFFNVNANTYKSVLYDGIYNISGSTYRIMGSGLLDSTTGSLTGVKLFLPSSNITGKFELYGIKKA